MTDFRVTGFVDDDNREYDIALEDAGSATPLGVEVVIATENLGEVQRIFQLVDPYRRVDGRSSGEGNQQEYDPDNPDQSDGAPPQEATPERLRVDE